MRNSIADRASPPLLSDGVAPWLLRIAPPLLALFFCTPNPRFFSPHNQPPQVQPAPPATPVAAQPDSTASTPQPDSVLKKDIAKPEPRARSLAADTAPLQSSWASAFEDNTPQPQAAASGERGIAVWYGPGFHGKKTASGERFDMNKFTAAHKTLPFNTMVKVTNLDNGLSVAVRINDRGPFNKNYCIDLSLASARRIGLDKSGTATVRIETVQKP